MAGLLLAVMAAAGSVCLCCGWVGCWDEFLFDRSSIMMMISLPLLLLGLPPAEGTGGVAGGMKAWVTAAVVARKRNARRAIVSRGGFGLGWVWVELP